MNLFNKLLQLLIDEGEALYFGEIVQCLSNYKDWQIEEAIETGLQAGIIKKYNGGDRYKLKYGLK